jgi:arsenite oxidase small subunit
VCGQATVNLTQIVLDYNPENDTIHAIAINGLIYGRQSNIL